MTKNAGIVVLFAVLFLGTAILNPQFLSAYNLQNLVRWTALFGVLSIGVSFVIITGGIDLSIGSVVGLVGCLLAWLLTERGWSVPAALAAVTGLSLAIGLAHGLLITRLGLQPFVVTLCGLLLYRGAARWLTGDQTVGFGNDYEGLRSFAVGKPLSLGAVALVASGGLALFWLRRALRAPAGERRGATLLALACGAVAAAGGLGLVFEIDGLSDVRAPTPFLVFLGLAFLSAAFLRGTVWGRWLFALGKNEEAARYCGIRTDRMVVLAYVLCGLCAGLGGVLFALDVNSVQPAIHGNFYELYAIAAAVLGGCSLRGGEGSVFGVVVGAAVMRVLYNSINLLQIPTQLEFAIIGAVLLIGVASDELVRRTLARRGRAPV